ncbi:DUF362 domain-containing protein [Halobacteria archaeon AArc-curdl1]|uniref:DUF362 domain-containing protein n=1 Tax=Natronosalvus hydrolyticus TaxID=2979988 RepID=A0AAP2Z737_9EURY|nr:DUF362 domain-containing protein [Halobacteria archaeon AArc-curdl1]
MEFPDTTSVTDVLDPIDLPEFVDVQYHPPSPEIDDVEAATRTEIETLPLQELKEGSTVAIGIGSRGIHDIVSIARATINEIRARGFEPVVVPAMGSHGGATADGQRRTLAALGLTEEALGCPIDARMETTVVGHTSEGGNVHVATAVREADATLVINRVKPHTNFYGPIESGLCKMLTVGLGKQAGAQSVHRQALVHGYVPVIEESLAAIKEELEIVGGIAIVENAFDRTAEVVAVPGEQLPENETDLLERARKLMPTLPFDDLDVLIVEQIGKDVSGSGMDTNVIGRYGVLNTDDPERPQIKRIAVLGLTEATHGNGQGIGLADVTTVPVIRELDIEQMYRNAATSSSLTKANIPIVMPDDESAVTLAASSIGPYDPESIKIAWIEDTAHLSSFRVSTAVLDGEDQPHVEVKGKQRLEFVDGDASFEPVP